MNKTGILIILSTGIIVALIFVFSNFNIQVNVNGRESQASASQQNAQAGAGSQDSMHGPAKPVDSTIFDSLLNKPAPDFTLQTYNDEKISLSSLKGKNVILFFSEGIMCYPACWNQMAEFGKDAELKSRDVTVLNIVLDSKDSWRDAVAKMPELSKATVLFDNGQVASSYGVLTLQSSMHRGQFPGHTYVVVDKEGVVRYLKDDQTMSIGDTGLISEIDKL